MELLSVNIAHQHTVDRADAAFTGIDKRPAQGPVAVVPVGPKGTAGSALVGDSVGDLRHHGGTHQAVYAFAREELDAWEVELGRPLANGVFGENLTTRGVDVDGALIGERWRIGREVILEVCSVRIPCRTFADWLGERGWVKRFTERARPGAYLRVIEPGEIRAGDDITVVHRPEHEVSVREVFRAATTEPERLPGLLAAGDALEPDLRARVLKRL